VRYARTRAEETVIYRSFSMRTLPLIYLLLAALPVMSDEAPRGIRVSGSGSVDALPDRATVVLGIDARNPSLAAARQRVARVARDFLDLVERLGIPDRSVTSTGANLRPEYRWDNESREQRFIGYQVQRQLVVQLEDLDLLGELIEGAVDSGVNQVSPPQLDSSRRKDYERQALAAAALDARANAEVLAKSLNAGLGELRSIEAMQSVPGPRPMMRAGAVAMEADSAVETYQAGELRFEARVNAEFGIAEP
jgi:uncharacterized protein YggE